ncbi:class I SAM-dependent methyltransferase [uncultured Enterococcus sp.]|uniref:class I SAM-dependent DNA methyltransferase n=1 Tax=uncultured Enterococcus sp. TaxID=167972 RepID=UPI002AA5FC12|nr:class I SAM-dependent methyltransferase [uncultured Enterococcus sp.]
MSNVDKFEMMAARYDSDERSAVATIIADELKKQLSPYGYETALDFGCGTGLVGLQLKDLFEEMIFTDPSPAMIEQVKLKLAEQKITTISALPVDLLSEAHSDIKVDCLYMSQVLLHIPDTKSVFEKLKPLINTGGRLMIVDFDLTSSITSTEIHPGFSHNQLITLANEAGYKDVTVQTFYHGKKLLMNQDSAMFLLEATV